MPGSSHATVETVVKQYCPAEIRHSSHRWHFLVALFIKVKTHRCSLFLDHILLEHISSRILLLEQVRVLTFFFFSKRNSSKSTPRLAQLSGSIWCSCDSTARSHVGSRLPRLAAQAHTWVYVMNSNLCSSPGSKREVRPTERKGAKDRQRRRPRLPPPPRDCRLGNRAL